MRMPHSELHSQRPAKRPRRAAAPRLLTTLCLTLALSSYQSSVRAVPVSGSAPDLGLNIHDLLPAGFSLGNLPLPLGLGSSAGAGSNGSVPDAGRQEQEQQQQLLTQAGVATHTFKSRSDTVALTSAQPSTSALSNTNITTATASSMIATSSASSKDDHHSFGAHGQLLDHPAGFPTSSQLIGTTESVHGYGSTSTVWTTSTGFSMPAAAASTFKPNSIFSHLNDSHGNATMASTSATTTTTTVYRANAIFPHKTLTKSAAAPTGHVASAVQNATSMYMNGTASVVTHTSNSTASVTSTSTKPASSSTSAVPILLQEHHNATQLGDKGDASSDSTWAPETASTAKIFASDVLASNKYAAFRLTSNQASYGPSEVRADLRKIMAWAGDAGALSTAQEDETVAAILSVAARYYPELPTRAISRVLMADIKAESDFNPKLISPGRLDSGDSWGLMQVSPGGESQELKLFKTKARTAGNSFSWIYQPSKGLTMIAQPGYPNAGPLLDWKTGKEMDLASLTNQDLFRPWVNIHVASWIQVNSARTSSQDPSVWDSIARASQQTTQSAQQLLQATDGTFNSGSGSGSGSGPGSLLSINIGGIKVSIPSLRTAHLSDLAKLSKLLTGASLSRSVRTGLGTWVAGPATTGEGGFEQNGDDISKQYLKAIVQGVGVAYSQDVKTSWLDGLKLNAGLVDYRP
ncbi:hypothetical protein OC845_001864 [Tilletia horrida]|nr:hypothetical protein OC845_001864 [Tilletia horrida]